MRILFISFLYLKYRRIKLKQNGTYIQDSKKWQLGLGLQKKQKTEFLFSSSAFNNPDDNMQSINKTVINSSLQILNKFISTFHQMADQNSALLMFSTNFHNE